MLRHDEFRVIRFAAELAVDPLVALMTAVEKSDAPDRDACLHLAVFAYTRRLAFDWRVLPGRDRANAAHYAAIL